MENIKKKPLPIIIFGTLGIGKSSFLNFMTGKQAFVTSDDAVGCTQKFSKCQFDYEGQEYIVVDSPGTNDFNLPYIKWANTLTTYAKQNPGQRYGVVILAFQSNVRPSASQLLDLITVFESVIGVDYDSLGIVFTFGDMIPKMDSHAANWLGSLFEKSGLSDNYENISKDTIPRHFIYSNEWTEQEKYRSDFFEWLKALESVQRQKYSLKLNKDFNLDVLQGAVEDSGDQELAKLLESSIKEIQENLLDALKDAESIEALKQEQSAIQDYNKDLKAEYAMQQKQIEMFQANVDVETNRRNKQTFPGFKSFFQHLLPFTTMLTNEVVVPIATDKISSLGGVKTQTVVKSSVSKTTRIYKKH